MVNLTTEDIIMLGIMMIGVPLLAYALSRLMNILSRHLDLSRNGIDGGLK